MLNENHGYGIINNNVDPEKAVQFTITCQINIDGSQQAEVTWLKDGNPFDCESVSYCDHVDNQDSEPPASTILS